MITLWLWDADGPHGSVAGDPGDARRAARNSMLTTGADTAVVHEAVLVMGGGWMQSGYAPNGTGWTARRNGSQIRWTPFRNRRELAAS